jgi:fibronectin-binding autotransporter adhesin
MRLSLRHLGGVVQSVAVASCLAVGFAALADAATVTWNTTTGTWDTTTGNWTGGSPVANLYVEGDAAIFNSTSGGTVTIQAGGVAPASTTVSAASGTYTFDGGPLGGTGSLTKSGGGTLVFSGDPATYSGGTTITGGRLNAPAASLPSSGSISLGAGTLNITSGTLASNITLTSNSSRLLNGTYSGSISGANTLNFQGTVTLAGSNSMSGDINPADTTSRLNINHESALGTGTAVINQTTYANTSGSPLTIANNFRWASNNFVWAAGTLETTGTFFANSGGRFSVDGGTLTLNKFDSSSSGRTLNLFSGPGLLHVKNAAGTNVSGQVDIASAGDFNVRLGHGSALGSGNWRIGNSNAVISASNDIEIPAPLVTFTAGTVTFSGSNSMTFSGNWEGQWRFDTTTNSWLTNDVAAGKSVTLQGTMSIRSATATTFTNFRLRGTGDTTFEGVIQNGGGAGFNGGFIVDNSGTTTFSNVANTYTGVTTVNFGTLRVASLADGGVASSLGQSSNAASNLVLNGVRLTYIGSGNSATNRAFSLAASSTIESSGTGTLSFTDPSVGLTYGAANQARTLTLRGTNTGANDFGKNLTNNGSGAVSLTKTDAGRWILSGTNTYTGATSVQAGVLLIDGSTGSSAVSVSSGAVIGGDGTIGGNLTLSDGGLFAFDTGSTLSLTGNLSLNSSFGVASLRSVFGSAVDWAAVSAGTYTLLNTSFSFNDTNISNFGEANQATGLLGGRSAYFQQGTSPTTSLQLVVVPEPATLGVAAAATGLVGLGLYRRRRQGPRA